MIRQRAKITIGFSMSSKESLGYVKDHEGELCKQAKAQIN